MTHQPADPWASLCLFLAAYTVKTSAHLASEALVFLFPAAHVAHTLPWIAAYGHSLFFRPHSPPLFPHPLTHWRKAWVPSVVERLLLASQAAIFLFTDFFLLLKYKHKARAYLRNTCLPHWFSLLLLHKSCLHNIAHGSWQHTLTGRVNCKI